MKILKSLEWTRKLIERILNYLYKKNKKDEYYLKLEGYYFNRYQDSYFVVIRPRNKRYFEKISLKEILNHKEYIKELHPIDACILGVLVNQQNNGFFDEACNSLRKMNRFKDHACFYKINQLLEITKKFISQNGIEAMIIKSNHHQKEFLITIEDIWRKRELLHGINSLQAIEVGYNISEYFIQKNAR